MIKKVVLEKSKRVERKFPEFDDRKIYISTTPAMATYPNSYAQLVRESTGFRFINNGQYVRGTYNNSFDDLAKAFSPVYILNNQQDLARFIMGCREFPTVQEEVVEVPCDVDEVLIDDVRDHKIYGYFTKGSVYKIAKINDRYGLVNLSNSWTTLHGDFATIKDLYIKTKEVFYSLRSELYQFDTLKEFIKWSDEKVNG